MDAFVDEGIRQIALEGRRGCSLRQFWSLLEEELPISGCESLTQEIKVFIWRSLVNVYKTEFGIYIPEEIAKQSNIAHFESKECGEDESMLPKKVRVSMDDEKAKDLNFLNDSDTTLIAVEPCRFHFLGICDAVTCRFRLSKKQIETLEEIGKARRKGCLQSDLARTVGVAHKNFFFVMKQLEGRQLAVRNPVILNRSNESDCHVSATNIIHLPIFAPDVKLDQFQAFSMVADSEFDDLNDDGEASTYRMRDDASWLRQISEKISEAKNRVALEFDVKQALGFRHAKGHRMWRRLKKKMIDLQLIKSFVASVDGKPSVCIELLPEDFDKWLEEQKQQEKAASLRGPESCIVAEQSLNRQLFQMIVESGPHGLSTKELFGRLRLNSKRNMHRLKAMQTMYGIQIHAESCGKGSVNRCFAPMSAIRKQLTDSAPVPIPSRTTTPIPVEDDLMDIKDASLAQEDTTPERQADDEHPSQDLNEEGTPLPSYPDPDDEAQKRMRSYLFSHLVSSRSDFRCQHLLEKINTEGFVSRSHIGSFIRDVEEKHGLSSMGNGPDRKTIDRVIQRLISEDKIKKLKVSVWTKSGGEPKLMDVLFKKDLEMTEEVLRRVRQTDEVFAAACRQRAHVRFQSESRQAHGENLPIIDDLTRLPRSRSATTVVRAVTEQGLAFQQIHKNGFVNARVTRAKLLHHHICRLVGLGGYSCDLAAERTSDHTLPRSSGRVSTETLFTMADSGSNQSRRYRFAKQTKGVKQEPLSEVHTESTTTATHDYSFTPRQIWDLFPTDLYLKVVGSSNKSEEIVQLAGPDLRMCDLGENKQELFVDRLARSRLADMLDLLCRLKLIERSIGVSESGAGLLESSRFVAHDTGVLEEPEIDEKRDKESQTTKREVQCALDTAEGLEMYWLRLEYTFAHKKHLSEFCFPSTVASEVCAVSNWSTSKSVPTSTWLIAQQMMDAMEPLDWKKCSEIAKRLKVEYYQVLRMTRDRHRKKSSKSASASTSKQKKPKRRPYTPRTPKAKRRKKIAQRSAGVLSGLDSGFEDQHPTGFETSTPFSEEKLRTGYWYREEDVDLLSGYYAWLTSSKAPKSGPRWTSMIGLPGGSSTAALHRSKRRLRYLQKQEHLKELFSDLEEVTATLYQQRWERVMEPGHGECSVVPDSIKQEAEQNISRGTEYTPLPNTINSDAEKREAIGMEVFRLNAFTVMTQFRGMNVLDVMLQTCDEEDAALIQRMKELVLEIAEKGPRNCKKETEQHSTSSTAPKQRSIPEFVDLSSSVVSAERSKKTHRLRVCREHLSLEEEPTSLSVAIAKDFILSCLYCAHNHRHLTKDVAEQLTSRFKDEELRKALGLLYKQGWINPGSITYPITLSTGFKKKMANVRLPQDAMQEAVHETAALSPEDWNDAEKQHIHDCDATNLSVGALFAILSAVVMDEVTLSLEDLATLYDFDASPLDDIPVRVTLPKPRTPRRGKARKKGEGLRRTFSELLRESELDEEMENSAAEEGSAHTKKLQKTISQPDSLDRHQQASVRTKIVETIQEAGDEGLSQTSLLTTVQEGEDGAVQSEAQSVLDELCAENVLLRCLQGPKGRVYVSKDNSDRFVFELPAEGCDMEIRPWRDHNGNIQQDMLQKLQQQILSTVLESPGISEDLLVDAIGYCSVHSARELCRAMVKQGLLKKEHITETRPSSLIPSFLDDRMPAEETVTSVVYFADLKSCFQRNLPLFEHLNG